MIGLDGADSDLIDRWSTDGTLPNLAALRARGVARHLSAPPAVTDDALWASFQYATGLGEHGRYHYYQRLAGGSFGMAFHDETGRDCFWHSLSAAGRRVAILDVPKCAAPRPLNGVHLADWLVHGRYFAQPQSYPETLAGDIVARYGAAPPSVCGHPEKMDDAHSGDVAANLLAAVRMKRAAALDILGREAWDLAVVAFKEIHCAGHTFWDVVDPSHPDFDAARQARLGDPVRRIVVAVDRAIGEVVAAAGAGAAVVVFSTTRMQPNASLQHFDTRLSRRINRALAEGPLAQAARRLRGRRAPVEFLPYNENNTAIRINGPGGRPVPPERREALRERVASIFAGLEDADTGAALTETVDRPVHDTEGARAGLLPDLLVRYRPGHIPRAIRGPGIGTIEATPPVYRAGNHAAGPFAVATGIDLARVDGLEDFGGLAAGVLGVRG